MALILERSMSRISEIAWTPKMKSDLRAIHKEALEDFNSDDPPRYLCSGNVVSVRVLVSRKWEELGYGHYQLTPQDLQDQTWKLKYDYSETATTNTDGLRKVLEELEKGNDVSITDVINFVKELYKEDEDESGRDSHDEEAPVVRKDIEIKASIIRKLNLDPDTEYLNLIQCMEFLSTELRVDKEEELLKAFEVFDKKKSGTISLFQLKKIMEEQGQPLNEEELKLMEECSRMYEVEEKPFTEESEPGDDVTVGIVDSGKGGKGGKGHKTLNILKIREGKKAKALEKKERKRLAREEKEDETDPDDIRVDYKAFVKGLMEKINSQERNLWGRKK